MRVSMTTPLNRDPLKVPEPLNRDPWAMSCSARSVCSNVMPEPLVAAMDDRDPLKVPEPPSCWMEHDTAATGAHLPFWSVDSDSSVTREAQLQLQFTEALPLCERSREPAASRFGTPTAYWPYSHSEWWTFVREPRAMPAREAYHTTNINVDSGCCLQCLQRVRQSLGNACLLVFSGEGRALKLVEKASALQLAVKTLEITDDSRGWGSIHIPDVLVFADSAGRRVEPWHVNMIYSRVHAVSGMEAAFRIASKHGYDELVVGDFVVGASSTGAFAPAQTPFEIVSEVTHRLDFAPRTVTIMIASDPFEDAE